MPSKAYTVVMLDHDDHTKEAEMYSGGSMDSALEALKLIAAEILVNDSDWQLGVLLNKSGEALVAVTHAANTGIRVEIFDDDDRFTTWRKSLDKDVAAGGIRDFKNKWREGHPKQEQTNA